MKWRTCKAEEGSPLAEVLGDDGWEPFAVTREQGADGHWRNFVWFRRKNK